MLDIYYQTNPLNLATCSEPSSGIFFASYVFPREVTARLLEIIDVNLSAMHVSIISISFIVVFLLLLWVVNKVWWASK